MLLSRYLVFLPGLFLSVVFPALAEKPVVSIARIQTTAQNISCSGWDTYVGRNCNQDLAEGFRAIKHRLEVNTSGKRI